jgi:uncharacterized membrane protein (UPF0127 family)
MNTDKEFDPVEVYVRREAVKDLYASLTKRRVLFEDQIIQAHVAETQAQKIAGLEIAEFLDEDEGMWFPFERSQNVTFHMGAVKFPIDILFLQKDFEGYKIAKIIHNVQPGSLDRWSHNNVDVVLEINGGLSKQLGIKVGSICKSTIRIGKRRKGV